MIDCKGVVKVVVDIGLIFVEFLVFKKLVKLFNGEDFFKYIVLGYMYNISKV